MVGNSVEMLIHCNEGVTRESLLQAVDTGHPFTERELNLSLPDGKRATVDCTVIPLHETDVETTLLIEIQQIDRQLRISREEHLLSQHQAAQELIRGLAHEIKNPLGVTWSGPALGAGAAQ